MVINGLSRQSQLACHTRVDLQNTGKARIASPDGDRRSTERGALTLYKGKALKCKPSAEFGGNIGIFGLKTTFHAYVLGEHTSMKNEL